MHMLHRTQGSDYYRCLNIDWAWVHLDHHGVLTLAANSTRQLCASSDVYDHLGRIIFDTDLASAKADLACAEIEKVSGRKAA